MVPPPASDGADQPPSAVTGWAPPPSVAEIQTFPSLT